MQIAVRSVPNSVRSVPNSARSVPSLVRREEIGGSVVECSVKDRWVAQV